MLCAQLRIIRLRLCECQVLCNKGRDEEFILYPVWGSVTNDSNHWILWQPDQVNKIDPWPGGPKSYLQQLVIASPVISQTKMEEPQTAVLPVLGPIIRLCCASTTQGANWMDSSARR